MGLFEIVSLAVSFIGVLFIVGVVSGASKIFRGSDDK